MSGTTFCAVQGGSHYYMWLVSSYNAAGVTEELRFCFMLMH